MNMVHFFQLVIYRAGTKLRADASHDYLHYLWWVIEPLANMFIYYLVFAVGLRRGSSGFVPFLLVGVVTWLWFNKSINGSAMSIFMGRAIFHQVPITKSFFPLVLIFADTARHIVVVLLLLIFLIWSGFMPTLTWLSLIPLLLCQFLLIIGCALLISAIVQLLPDLRFVINLGLHFTFFASGIFFDIYSEVPVEYHKYILLNPMAGIILNFRQVLIHGAWPDWQYISYVSIFAVFLIFCARTIIKKLDYIYPKVVV